MSPKRVAGLVGLGGENAPTYAVIAAICAVGVVLRFQAYRPSGPSR